MAKGDGKKKAGGKPKADPPAAPKEITKIGSGSVIEQYTSPKGIVCPTFWNFKPFNGCNYDCQWCYLNGTMFRWKGVHAKDPHQKYEKGAIADLEKALVKLPAPILFNGGELADGLLFEGFMINQAIPRFAEAYRKATEESGGKAHKLLIVTKSESERAMVACTYASNCVVFSHSVNAKMVARKWELKAPHPWARLKASQTADSLGYETRLRIDPMVPVEHWQEGYLELCDKIMEFNPNVSVITIGSLRALQSTVKAVITMRKDRSWIPYCTEDSPFGKRIPFQTRVALYEFMISALRNAGYKGKIGVCKETPDVWKKLKEDGVLGNKPGEVKCNCQI